MKKLVLVAFVSTIAANLIGCTVEEGDDGGGDPVIFADIELLNGGAGPIVCLNDPSAFPGQDGLRVNARVTGTQSGVSDVYNCNVVSLQTPPLTAGFGDYDVWVDYINDRGFPDDPSQWVVVDTTDYVTVNVQGDLHVDRTLTLNNGFFEANWEINAGAVPCPPNGGVSILGTIVGGGQAFDDIFNCEDGEGTAVDPQITDPTPIDDYTVVATLLDGDNGDARLGASDPITTSIDSGNEYVDLGIINIILD